MGVVKEIVNEGVDRLVSILESFDEASLLLITSGSFLYRKNYDSNVSGELGLIHEAIKQRRIKSVGSFVFSGIKINYKLNLRRMAGYFVLVANYTVANEVVRYRYTLQSATGKLETINLTGANRYAFEIRIDPVYNVGLFAFNISTKVAPLTSPNNYLAMEPMFKKILASFSLFNETTFLNMIKNSKDELKESLLSVLGEFA